MLTDKINIEIVFHFSCIFLGKIHCDSQQIFNCGAGGGERVIFFNHPLLDLLTT